jgi:hypothetical protein
MEKSRFTSFFRGSALLFAIALSSTALLSVLVDGTWSGDVHLPNGCVVPVVINLKAEGKVLSGTLAAGRRRARQDHGWRDRW